MKFLFQLTVACLALVWFAYADTVPISKPTEKVKVDVPVAGNPKVETKAVEKEAVEKEAVEKDVQDSSTVDDNEEAESDSSLAEDNSDDSTDVSSDQASEKDMQESLKEMNEQANPLAEQDKPTSDKVNTALSLNTAQLDSLGITPDTVVATPDGGTRKTNLQRTVFHREQPFVYQSAGHRDPFRALIVDEKKEGEIATDLLRMEGASLAGVVWSQGMYLAIVRDADGQSFFLREGDPVFSGRLVTVTETQASFEMNEFGDYQRITLKVVPKVAKKDKG